MNDVLPNEGIGELAAALSRAQGIIKPAAQDRDNPHLKSRYATLTSVWEACREPLSANGLAVVQLPTMAEEGWIGLETRLIHSSGQQLVSVFRAPIPENRGLSAVQALGSALTYLRRYALAAMVGIVADEDNDGHGEAAKPQQRRQEPPQRTPAPRQEPAAPPAESRGDAAANGHAAPPTNTAAGQCPSCFAPVGKPHAKTCKERTAPTPAPTPVVVEDPIGAHIADESAHKRLTATLESRWKRYADILDITHADAAVKRLGIYDSLLGRGWPTEPTLFDLQELVAIFDRELAKLTGTVPATDAPSPFDDDEQPALALA